MEVTFCEEDQPVRQRPMWKAQSPVIKPSQNPSWWSVLHMSTEHRARSTEEEKPCWTFQPHDCSLAKMIWTGCFSQQSPQLLLELGKMTKWLPLCISEEFYGMLLLTSDDENWTGIRPGSSCVHLISKNVILSLLALIV